MVENASLKGVRKTLTQEGFDRLTAAQQKSFMRAVEKGDAALARSELTGTSRTVTTGGPGGRADMVIKQPPKMTRTQYKNLNPAKPNCFNRTVDWSWKTRHLELPTSFLQSQIRH